MITKSHSNIILPSVTVEKSSYFKKSLSRPGFSPGRTMEYFGNVNYGSNERILNLTKEGLVNYPEEELYLVVTSAGGAIGTALSFYDSVRSILHATITTIASGDVDSSGVLIFLAGQKRYVTKHTTLLLNLSGRTFESGKRYTAEEMAAMLKEDRIKNKQYACVIAEHSNLTLAQVMKMMRSHTLLTPERLVKYGLAEAVLD